MDIQIDIHVGCKNKKKAWNNERLPCGTVISLSGLLCVSGRFVYVFVRWNLILRQALLIGCWLKHTESVSQEVTECM